LTESFRGERPVVRPWEEQISSRSRNAAVLLPSTNSPGQIILNFALSTMNR
jgi:hypothetical protein